METHTPGTFGQWGELVACWFLEGRGIQIVATNVRVGRGEIDIVARDGCDIVAVEVRSRRGDLGEVTAVDMSKLAQMNRNARAVSASRVDLVVIAAGTNGIQIQWSAALSW